MSDNFQHIDVDSDEFVDAPKALRDHVKKLQRTLTEKDAEVGTLRNQINSRAVADVLADKGFKNPARVQKDMLADQIDPTDTSSVETWLAANSDDYARQTGTETPDEAPPELHAEDAQAFEQMNVTNVTPGSTVSSWEKVQKLITPDMTGEQVAQLYAEHGI